MRLLAEEALQQRVEPLRVLEHRRRARCRAKTRPHVGDRSPNRFAWRERDQRVVRAPHDERRASDLRQPVADAVGRPPGARGGSPACRRPRQQLVRQRRREAVRVARAKRSATWRMPRAPRHLPCGRRRASDRGERAAAAPSGVALALLALIPAAETSTSRSTRCGEGDRQLRGDEPAHRVAHEGGGRDARASHTLLHEAGVAGDRDRPAGIGEAPKPGRSTRDHAMRAREVGDVLEPVLPTAGEAVHEQQRRAGAELDDVGRRPVHLDPALVRRPVDVQPG